MNDSQAVGVTPPLARIEGETSKWFERFLPFIRLKGNLFKTFEEETGRQGKAGKGRVPGAWSRAAERNRWRERFEAFQGAQQAAERQELSAVLLEQRKKRVDLLRQASTKLSLALSILKSKDMDWKTFFAGLRIVGDCQREEIHLGDLEERFLKLESRLGRIEQ